MEYCIYGNLQYHLSTRRSLPVIETQQLAFQIVEGLHEMHENDFAHTDLKPRVRSMCIFGNYLITMLEHLY